jgi:hypothetical protein
MSASGRRCPPGAETRNTGGARVLRGAGPTPAKRPPGQARGPLQAQRPGSHGRVRLGHRPGGSAPREAGFTDPNDNAQERSPSTVHRARRTAHRPRWRSRHAPGRKMLRHRPAQGCSVPARSAPAALKGVCRRRSATSRSRPSDSHRRTSVLAPDVRTRARCRCQLMALTRGSWADPPGRPAPARPCRAARNPCGALPATRGSAMCAAGPHCDSGAVSPSTSSESHQFAYSVHDAPCEQPTRGCRNGRRAAARTAAYCCRQRPPWTWGGGWEARPWPAVVASRAGLSSRRPDDHSVSRRRDAVVVVGVYVKVEGRLYGWCGGALAVDRIQWRAVRDVAWAAAGLVDR